MARIKGDNASEAVVGIRPMTKPTVATRSLGLEVATLREAVDGLEMRVDDVDARVSTLEMETSTDALDALESLARGIPQGDERDATASAIRENDDDPTMEKSGSGDAEVPSNLTKVSRPQPPSTSERDTRLSSGGVLVALTDGQFAALFGIGAGRDGGTEDNGAPARSDHAGDPAAV